MKTVLKIRSLRVVLATLFCLAGIFALVLVPVLEASFDYFDNDAKFFRTLARHFSVCVTDLARAIWTGSLD